MRTSLIDIQQTEQYLQAAMSAGDALVFEARLLTDPVLEANMQAQKKCYRLLQQYHMQKIRRRVEEAHLSLFTDPAKSAFQQTIKELFNR